MTRPYYWIGSSIGTLGPFRGAMAEFARALQPGPCSTSQVRDDRLFPPGLSTAPNTSLSYGTLVDEGIALPAEIHFSAHARPTTTPWPTSPALAARKGRIWWSSRRGAPRLNLKKRHPDELIARSRRSSKAREQPHQAQLKPGLSQISPLSVNRFYF